MRQCNATTITATIIQLLDSTGRCWISFISIYLPSFHDIKKLGLTFRSYVQKTTWVFGFWLSLLRHIIYYLASILRMHMDLGRDCCWVDLA